MAYSAYCDTASHTKWWIIGTGSVINRLSEVMDDNASGVEEDDNPGNYQPWSEFVTETVEDEIYLIHQNLEIGDGSTSTTITSLQEYVSFDSGIKCEVQANATLTIGELYGSWGISGSTFRLSGPAASSSNFCDGGTINIYASLIRTDDNSIQKAATGTFTATNTIFEANYNSDNSFRRRFEFTGGLSSYSFNKVYFNDVHSLILKKSPASAAGVHVHRANMGIEGDAVGVEFTGVLFSSIGANDIYIYTPNNTNDYTVEVIDPALAISSVLIEAAADNDFWVGETYSCNIEVAGKDGVLLDGVEVLCEDEADATVWTTTTGDTDTGKIDEQQIPYKKWIGPDEDLTTYSPHKFTISKAGYETLVLENITVDSPIVWHLELQDPVSSGGGAKVKHIGIGVDI